MLPPSIRREIKRLDDMSNELGVMQSRDAVNEDEKFDFQDKASDLINKTSLLLDKIMNQIWLRHNESAPGSEKANVYFPVYDSRKKFDDALQRMQLASLAERAPALRELLWLVQPGASGNTWLRSLKRLAGLRHQRQANIEEKKFDMIGPTPGSGMQFGVYTVKDGRLEEDHPAWAKLSVQLSAIGKSDAEIAAVRMPVREYTTRVLEETNLEPAEFCTLCIREIRKLAVEIFAHLDRSQV